jgi:signal transduction histidine kinase
MPAGISENRGPVRPSIAATDWRTWVSLSALVLALVALVLLPVLRARLVEPLHEDLRAQIEPARSLVTRIHLSLAMEGTLAREFIERRDTLLIAGYREALADELDAYNQLEPHMNRLGPGVRSEFNALKVLQTSWHSAIERSFSSSAPGADISRQETARSDGGADPFHPAEYERLLIGAARLDEALSNAADRRWAEAAATNRAQRWLTGVVGLIALGAALIVAWLGRGLRLFAVAAERDKIELQHAIEARARLVRGITHDLKNPLNAIVGYTDLLSQGVKGPVSPPQAQSLNRIHRSAESLLSLIEDILDMSRAERGQLTVVSQSTRIESVIEDSVEEQAARAAASGHRIDIEVPADLPAITTDPQRVRQVLGNLLTNAIKYTPSGAPILVRSSIRSRQGAIDGERWVAIQVVDAGPGIPDDKVPIIFEEFTRLDMHRNTPGAGLGLAIALRISRLLGGDLTVDHGEGRGSVFTLWLPLQTASSPLSSIPPSEYGQPRGTPSL